jgi:uncharacterized membrane protein
LRVHEEGESQLQAKRVTVQALFASLALLLLFNTASARAQESPLALPPPQYFRAQVVRVLKQGVRSVDGVQIPYQQLQVKLVGGSHQGQELTFLSGYTSSLTPAQMVKQGEAIVLTSEVNTDGSTQYQVLGADRTAPLLYLVAAFAIAVIVIARWKGVGSLLGLSVSLGVVVWYVVPQILAGADPLRTCVYASLGILFVTTYLAHGVSRQTTVALLSTFVALMATVGLSSILAAIAHITGFNSDAMELQFGPAGSINMKGLLLGGTIIGTLGALNDITTTQAAAIFELARTDRTLTFLALFRKGFGIGREHAVSLVNTLMLAYAGASLILFLFVGLNPQHVPLWVMLSSEDTSDEVVRMVAGSLGLLLVIPIVTTLAAALCDQGLAAVTSRGLRQLWPLRTGARPGGAGRRPARARRASGTTRRG